MNNAIKQLGRLHELTKEKAELQQKLEEVIAPFKAELERLSEEDTAIRLELEALALQDGASKTSSTGTKYSLSFPGLGSVSVTEKEAWEIKDEKEALAICLDNPAFFEAADQKLNKKRFIDTALEIQKKTGNMIDIVEKVTKQSPRITLAKIEDNEE